MKEPAHIEKRLNKMEFAYKILKMLAAICTIVVSLIKVDEYTGGGILIYVLGSFFVSWVTNYISNILFFLVVLLSVIMVYGFFRRKKMWTNISLCYNSLHYTYKEAVHKLATSGNNKLNVSDFAEFNIKFLNIIASICTYYTGTECAACLKTFHPGTGMIRTEIRCTKSGITRKDHDTGELQKFSYNHNTAFKQIVESNTVKPYIGWFLPYKSYKKRYVNKNPEWNKHYNSTIVIPVASTKAGSNMRKSDLYGFLCVDSRGFWIGDAVLNNMLMQMATMWVTLFSHLQTRPSQGNVRSRKKQDNLSHVQN